MKKIHSWTEMSHVTCDMFKVDLGVILKWKGIELDGMSFWTT